MHDNLFCGLRTSNCCAFTIMQIMIRHINKYSVINRTCLTSVNEIISLELAMQTSCVLSHTTLKTALWSREFNIMVV